MDIIILLLCTFFIINRLIKILGQYDPDRDNERREKNSVIIDLFKQKYHTNVNEKIITPQVVSSAELNLSEDVQAVFQNIRKQDNEFDFDRFINGAKKAYIMYIKAKTENDQETLINLLDADLLKNIKKNQHDGFTRYVSVSELTQITVVEAALFGDRAMITVLINSREIHYIEDSNGNLISGEKDKVIVQSTNVTFCRYLTQEKIWKITKIH